MTLTELFIIAIGLSMDAFAVSICKGLSLRELKARHALSAGLYFGGFQALMPLIGYLLATNFQTLIVNIDHWIAFILLCFIGINMIKEAKEEECLDDSFSFKAMLPLAIATSIDALAVGVTFAFLKVKIMVAVVFIGITTFILSMIGIKFGHIFGSRFKSKAEIFGGIVLILMGVKILIEHLNLF